MLYYSIIYITNLNIKVIISKMHICEHMYFLKYSILCCKVVFKFKETNFCHIPEVILICKHRISSHLYESSIKKSNSASHIATKTKDLSELPFSANFRAKTFTEELSSERNSL